MLNMFHNKNIEVFYKNEFFCEAILHFKLLKPKAE